MLMTLYSTGMRRAELSYLKVEDIDRDRCARCGYTAAISYNSCRNRHCSKYQTNARDKRLAARQQELLAVHCLRACGLHATPPTGSLGVPQ